MPRRVMVAVTDSADCTTTRAPSAHEKSRAPTVGSGRSAALSMPRWRTWFAFVSVK